MFDIVTFGSAAWDIFFSPQKPQILKKKRFIAGKGICFGLGSKIEVKEIAFGSGGGGTNTAVTFSRQGLRTAYCGRVGDDLSGREIVEELGRSGVNCQFILRTKEKPTNHSVILSVSQKDRTVLAYRGASEIVEKKDIPWQRLRSRWFYLAPLSGKLAGLSEALVEFASKNQIKIAFNPGNSQLSLPKKTLKRILEKVDILILNQEEASFLAKLPFNKEERIFSKIDKICSGIVVMTKGPKGVVVSDGKFVYRAKPLKSKVVDRTGAGDSFASGFVSGFIKSEGNIKYAIHLAMANSASCLKKWGAKKGLLKKGTPFEKVKVVKRAL